MKSFCKNIFFLAGNFNLKIIKPVKAQPSLFEFQLPVLVDPEELPELTHSQNQIRAVKDKFKIKYLGCLCIYCTLNIYSSWIDRRIARESEMDILVTERQKDTQMVVQSDNRIQFKSAVGLDLFQMKSDAFTLLSAQTPFSIVQ